MNFFWRLVSGFALVAFAVLSTQFFVESGYSRQRFVPSWQLSGSPLVVHQGYQALQALRGSGKASAVSELEPLNESGLHAWLVTTDGAFGSGIPPPAGLESAQKVVLGKSTGGIFWGYRVISISRGREKAALLLVLPGFTSLWIVVLRTFLLLSVTGVICYFLAKRFSNHIQRLGLAADAWAQGNLDYRIGKLKAPIEIQLLGKSFDSLAERLQVSNLSRQRLLGDLSHEIRSPLGRLKMAAALLEHSSHPPQKYLTQIHRDVSRLDDLVSGLSSISTEHFITPRFEPVHLETLLSEVLISLSIESETKGIRLLTDFVQVEVSGDSRAIYSCIENVLRNALIHAPSGSEVTVVLAERPPQIQISDRGSGVSESELEDIFEPFYRSSAARDRDHGGVGLGLAIVRKAMREHGGEATAKNRENGGLVVTLTFPDAVDRRDHDSQI